MLCNLAGIKRHHVWEFLQLGIYLLNVRVVADIDKWVGIGDHPAFLAELKKLPHVVSFDASEIAKQLKARSNMVLLGATVPYLGISIEKVEEAIAHIFGKKGQDVVELNIKAVRAGYEQAVNS